VERFSSLDKNVTGRYPNVLFVAVGKFRPNAYPDLAAGLAMFNLM
jgi:hypothetical protein